MKNLREHKSEGTISMLQNKKVIFFDMDGTLIDSVGVWNDIDRKLLLKLGAPQLEQEDVQLQRDTLLRQYRAAQNPYQEYCRYLGEKYQANLTPAEIMKLRYDIATEYLTQVVDYKPDAEHLLRLLKAAGFRLAIVTTTKKGNMDIYRTQNKNIMAKAALADYFSPIYTREDATEIKPSPEIYHRAMRELAVEPKDCLIFEDSLIGVEAANHAGIEVAAMYDQYSDHEREAINQKATYQFADYRAVIAAVTKELQAQKNS